MTLDIVTRSEWGARPARSRSAIDTPTDELYLHHTAGHERGPAGMRAIQDFHMDGRKWSDIAYSLVIDPDDLTIYEGRGIGIAGGHTKGRNTVSHAICVMGNFDQENASPTLLRLIADLVRHGREHGWWGDHFEGHRDAPGASTACPGRHLYAAIPEIRALAATSRPQEDDDMAMSPSERKAFIDDIAGEVHKRVVLSLFAEDTDDDKAEVRHRDSLASLIRRILGVPPMADGKEQHKADEDTGKRLQKLLGD